MNRNRYYDMRRDTGGRPAAAALHYDPVKPGGAPEVVAVGRGAIADEILALAKKHGIPIHNDRGLVEALARLDVGTMIPRELYLVVAEILAFVYRIDAEQAAARKG